jgi:osmoprotectant transport system permease protein
VSTLAAVVAWFSDPAHWTGPNGIPVRLLEHIAISGASLVVALAIALPVGFAIGHTGRGASVAINAANFGRALPSLAAIAIVYPITVAIDPQWGFYVAPTLIAMVVLAVPPILVNAYAGIQSVDRELIEAARAMGLRERQVLFDIEIPIGLSVVGGGIRSAAVQIVATATLGAIFGFGGLGRYLVDGVAQNDEGQTFGGVILVAGLAIVTELGFGLLERAMTSPGLALREDRGAPVASASGIRGPA